MALSTGSDWLSWELHGVEELVDRLSKLTNAIQGKAVRTAGRQASNLIRDNVKWRAKQLDDPSTAESIAENVVVRYASRTAKREGGAAFRVGVLGGAKSYVKNKTNERKQRTGKQYATGGSSENPGGDTFYWRFVEFGTSNTRAQHFMMPALEESINPATDKFATVLAKEIDRALARIR